MIRDLTALLCASISPPPQDWDCWLGVGFNMYHSTMYGTYIGVSAPSTTAVRILRRAQRHMCSLALVVSVTRKLAGKQSSVIIQIRTSLHPLMSTPVTAPATMAIDSVGRCASPLTRRQTCKYNIHTVPGTLLAVYIAFQSSHNLLCYTRLLPPLVALHLGPLCCLSGP